MPDVLITCYGEYQVAGKTYRFGSPTPQRHTLTGNDAKEQTFTIPGGTPGSTVLVWTALIDLPSAFEFLALETDLAVMLELVTDDGDEVGEESYTVQLLPGAPLILLSDTSYANYTAGFGGGTLDVIETIRARRESANDATLRMMIIES